MTKFPCIGLVLIWMIGCATLARQDEPAKLVASEPAFSEVTSRKMDIENGKLLFRDPALSGSVDDKSCHSCHKRGKGLEKAGRKTFRSFFGLVTHDLAEVINWCIVEPLGGKPLAKDSQEMVDLTAYVRTFNQR